MKRRHWLRELLGTLATFLALLLFIYFILCTDNGLRTIVWVAQRFMPSLKIEKMQGQLMGPIYLQNMQFQDKTAAISLKEAYIDWRPQTFLNPKIIFNAIKVNGLTINILNNIKESNKKTNLKWLQRIWINDLQLQDIVLQPGNVSLNVQGSVGSHWNINWQLKAEDTNKLSQVIAQNNKLSALLNSLQGELNAQGSIQGERNQPHLLANINANNLTIEKLQAAALQIKIDTNLAANANSNLEIHASQLKYQQYLAKTLAFQAQGNINLQATVSGASAEIIDPQLNIHWQLQTHLNSITEKIGNISAKGNVTGRLTQPQIKAQLKVDNLRTNTMRLPQLIADINADFSPEAISQVKFQLNQLKINQYHFSPITIQATLNRLRQHLQIDLAAGKVRYLLHDITHQLTWLNSSLQADWQHKGTTVQGRVALTSQQYLLLNLFLPDYQPPAKLMPQQTLQGNIGLFVQQIAPFTSDLKQVNNVKGTLHADLQIRGNYAKPLLLGSMALEQASFEVPALNLHVKNINVQAQGNPSGEINWRGSAQSGAGILQLNGNTLLRQASYPTTLSLSGNNVMVSNSNRYKINISPDLAIKFINKKLIVTGQVTVPTAHLNLGENAGDAVTLSNDVVFVSNKPTEPTTNFPITATIQLNLGEDVTLNFQGLKTYLRGGLLIHQAEKDLPVGTGKIEFHKGSYSYYGQTLKIREGSQIIFTGGSVENPTLNIQAVKTVTIMPTSVSTANTSSLAGLPNVPVKATDIVPTSTNLSSSVTMPGEAQKITVGVSVQGKVKNPQITLFSAPIILPQTEILSYLVLGQPSDQLGAGSAATLFTALSSLNTGGVSQFKDVVGSLQKKTGLDQLSIESNPYYNPQTSQTEQNTSLVLGKQLSPKLYISYSLGILQALNTLQISYLLNKYWTLQSSTSTIDNGVDLLYRIEKGH